MRGPRADRPLALLGLGTALFVVCIVAVGIAWFKLEPGPSIAKTPPLPQAESLSPQPRQGAGRAPRVPSAPFLEPLSRAAASWWESRGPSRTVVDQVCLVPDPQTFFEAIGQWDDQHYYPILIDDPAWTLPFLRAFRPSRVLRLTSRMKPTGEGRELIWSAAVDAVGRSWSHPGRSDSKRQDGENVPQGLGRTPPGVVLSDPESPMLAGGVALAAGRFQPLVRFEPWQAMSMALDVESRRPADRRSGFSTVLSLAEARLFARRLEDRVATVVADYRQLGDACDFLTLAGEWPYRYLNDREAGQTHGEAALDDLVGRILEPELANLGKSRDRWAFAGRLLGDPAASVYRAMCALFLPPDSALLWNTYGGNEPWKYYDMARAAEILARSIRGPLRHRAGDDANLLNWHQLATGSSDRTRLVFFNSSGEPKRFAIDGGAGRPADIPPGGPSAVVIIHSFSAADPTDPRTIAGRWLALGAFAYFGSMNEPYLNAFRPPSLEAELLAAAVPLAAAVREGPAEPFGQPWRLVYLGDPLYRLDVHTGQLAGGDSDPDSGGSEIRLDPRSWKQPTVDDFDRFNAVVVQPDSSASSSAEHGTADNATLLWCLDAAIADACKGERSEDVDPEHDQGPDWRPMLATIARDRLEARNRPIWDALVIDAALKPGPEHPSAFWYQRLANIPAAEWSPKVEAVQEYATTHRLASAARSEDFETVLTVWDAAIRRPWPTGSEFPTQLTDRVGATAGTAERLRQWHDHLLRASTTSGPASAIIAAERKRVESRLAEKR